MLFARSSDGVVPDRVELQSALPYSLRQTAEGNFVLHAIRSDSGDHRSYRVDRMQDASVTGQSFVPCYLVELSQGGPLPIAPAVSRPSSLGSPSWETRTAPRPRRAVSSRRDGPVHIYRCNVCGKNFQRK